MLTPDISIIIPVYNSEKYLAECLSSVLNQTLKNIEVVCVNDGSTDASLEILKCFSNKYSNLKIIDQKNTGASIARNNAIKQATAPYIMFVDSDDTIRLDACETAYNKILEQEADVVLFSTALVYNQKEHPRFAFGDKERVFGEEACKNILYRRCFGLSSEEMGIIEQQDYLSSVCLKIYKKSIIMDNRIEFYDIKKIGSYEDGFFNLQYFYFVKKAVYLPEILYYYKRDNSESNTSQYKENLPLQWKALFSLLKKEIDAKRLGYQFVEALDNRISISSIGLGLNIITKKCSIFEHTVLVREVISEERYRSAIKNMKFGGMAIHWKLFFLCCKFKLSFFVVLLLYSMDYLRRVK